MTREMKRLIYEYLKYFLLIFILSSIIGLFFKGGINTTFFNIGYTISTINICFTGFLLEGMLVNENIKINFILPFKIILIILLLGITYVNIQYSLFIISGVVLSLLLAVISLLKIQGKDV